MDGVHANRRNGLRRQCLKGIMLKANPKVPIKDALAIACCGMVAGGVFGAPPGLLFWGTDTVERVLAGALLGLLLGLALGLAIPGKCTLRQRGVMGGSFTGIVGLLFGFNFVLLRVNAGLEGAFIGVVAGASLLMLLRSRIILCVLVCMCISGLGENQPLSEPLEPLAAYDVSPQTLGRIQPGTVVGDAPPEGWSCLVLKSRYQLHSGDIERLPRAIADAFNLFFTVILAKVSADDHEARQPRYRLAELALGMGTSIKGQDTIINSATQKNLGANLGLVARAVLGQIEGGQEKVKITARSNRLAIIDQHVFLFQQGEHRAAVLRFALVVAPESGRIDTFVWSSQRRAQGQWEAGDSLEWLFPNHQESCATHVDASKFFLGLPTESSLGVVHLPRGRRQISLPQAFKSVAGQVPLNPDQAGEIHAYLSDIGKQLK